VKKFIVTLMLGAFLFSSMAAVVGCGESEADKKAREAKEKAAKEKDAKPADKDKKADKP